MPPEQKSNPLVEKAVNALNEKISHLRRLKLYEALKQGILLVGTRYLPDHLQSSEYIKDPAIPLPELCATSEAADGSANLWAFTHHAALVNHLKDAPYLYLDARYVLEIVIQKNYGGLIINPGASWAGVPREDIVRILEGTF